MIYYNGVDLTFVIIVTMLKPTQEINYIINLKLHWLEFWSKPFTNDNNKKKKLENQKKLFPTL